MTLWSRALSVFGFNMAIESVPIKRSGALTDDDTSYPRDQLALGEIQVLHGNDELDGDH